MIGWLSGIVRAKHPPGLLLDVGGVGYELEAPMGTFANLPATGESVSLYTHFIVREDAQQLYGFSAESERDVFRALLKVNGVGAKVALAILSGMDSETFTRCVVEGDTSALTRLPGIANLWNSSPEILAADVSKRPWRARSRPTALARSEASTTHASAIGRTTLSQIVKLLEPLRREA